MKMRSILSLFLCLTLVLALALPALAEDNETGGGNSGTSQTNNGSGSEGSGGNTGGGGTSGSTGGNSSESSGSSTGSGDDSSSGSSTGSGNSESPGSGSGSNPTTPSTHEHHWDTRKVTKAASCTEAGTMEYSCSCGAKQSETIPATGHVYDHVCDRDCNVCGAVRDVSHKPGKTWTKDASGHWHICSACGSKVEIGKHYPGPAATEDKDQICLTCGYLLTAKKGHIHKYQTTFTSDETGHWYACEGCSDQKDLTAHTYDDPCDPDCNVCGYKRNSAHYYGDTLQYDETTHWGICAYCGEVGSRDAHIPNGEATEDKPLTCVVCGMEMEPALNHVHMAENWTVDEQNHRKICTCGEVLEEGAHVWDEGTENPDSTVTYVCTQCGTEKTEGEPKEAASVSRFPWGIVILGVALVCVAAAGVILIQLVKKPAGKFSK